MISKSSYLSLAEDDYAFFMEALHCGMTYNAMATIAQNACERYLKDLIDRFYKPDDDAGIEIKDDIMKTNSLARLMKFIVNNMNAEITDEMRDAIERVDIYFYTVSYPGVNSIEVDDWDIKKAVLALENVRKFQTQLLQKYHEVCLGSQR